MKIRIDLKIMIFLGLFFITKQIKIYLIIMGFALLHELAHIMVALILKYKLYEFEIMPIGFCAGLKPKIEDYNKKIKKSNMVEVKNIFIAIAGPLTNIIMAVIFINIGQNILAYSNLVVFFLNVVPVYPLDGGRILRSLLRIIIGKKKGDCFVNVVGNIVVIILTICGSILVLFLNNVAIVLILAFLWDLIIKENKRFELKKRVNETLMEYEK